MSQPDRLNPYQPPQGELERADKPNPLFASLTELARESSYPPEALLLVLQALEFSTHHVQHESRKSGHIDAVDLCWCLHDWAMHRFGESAQERLESWNLKTTRDFGDVVYLLIHAGLMNESEDDSIEDFDNVFDFDDEFSWTAPLPSQW